MNWIKNFTLVLVVTGLSFEVLSFVATKLQLFLVNEIPSAYNFKSTIPYPDIAYGRTEREKWGAWHVSNSTFRHHKVCFDVAMTFNQVGARDDSFTNLPTTSLILLGDSFAEGFGVVKEETSEHLIEEGLGVSILNFGAAGNFGPLQELLIYEEFKHLPHQGLIVYVLPANDFTDNDIEVWRNDDQTRYRPYFAPTGDPLTPYYFPAAIPRDNFLSTSHGSIKQILKDYSWSGNALRTFSRLIRGDTQYAGHDRYNHPKPRFFFRDASDKQQSNLISSYEAILEAANNKNVLFVLIPVISDIATWESESDRDSYKLSSWYQSVMNFKNRTEQRVEVLNLFEYLPPQTKELFFECDGHWGPLGHAWASEVVMEYIRNSNLFEEIE